MARTMTPLLDSGLTSTMTAENETAATNPMRPTWPIINNGAASGRTMPNVLIDDPTADTAATAKHRISAVSSGELSDAAASPRKASVPFSFSTLI